MDIPRERCLRIRIAERAREDPQAAEALGIAIANKGTVCGDKTGQPDGRIEKENG